MRVTTSFLALKVLAFAAAAQGGPPAFDPRQWHFQNGCEIRDYRGARLAGVPGVFCRFFNDGSFLSSSLKELTYFDRLNRKVWTIEGHYHHQLGLSGDGKRLLLMGSEVQTNGGKKIRADVFQVLDRDGKELARTTGDAILKQKSLRGEAYTTEWALEFQQIRWEVTHFNSFYEIPPHPNELAMDLLPPGGYIVNSIRYGIFALTSDLKRVTWHFVHPKSFEHHVHDVQVTAAGRVLLFVNLTNDSLAGPYSSIREVDPLTREDSWEFYTEPKQFFYSFACGGVQELPSGHILFSDVAKGVYVVDRNSRQLIYHAMDIDERRNRGVYLSQEIKARNFDAFLKARANSLF